MTARQAKFEYTGAYVLAFGGASGINLGIARGPGLIWVDLSCCKACSPFR